MSDSPITCRFSQPSGNERISPELDIGIPGRQAPDEQRWTDGGSARSRRRYRFGGAAQAPKPAVRRLLPSNGLRHFFLFDRLADLCGLA